MISMLLLCQLVQLCTPFTDDCVTKQHQYQGEEKNLFSLFLSSKVLTSALVPFSTPGSPWSGLWPDCLWVESTVNPDTIYPNTIQNNILTVLIKCYWSVWMMNIIYYILATNNAPSGDIVTTRVLHMKNNLLYMVISTYSIFHFVHYFCKMYK